MSLKSLNEGFELSQFNVLQENVVNQITSILNTLNEATMSDEDKRDSKLLRQILSKASDASYDKRRALKWTPQELEIADKYNLTLPQRTTNWDGSKEITPLKDNDVDYRRGFGRNTQVRSLQRDLQQAKGLYYKTDANMADFIRKRKEKGPAQDRPYRQADKYARVEDVNTFGDTTFTHDNSGRFGQDRWDKEHNRPATLAGGPRDSDLTDVEKDRVAVNKQMSQPVRDMKAALADRKASQKKLDSADFVYQAEIDKLKKDYEDRLARAQSSQKYRTDSDRRNLDYANQRINSLLKKEDYNIMEKSVIVTEAFNTLNSVDKKSRVQRSSSKVSKTGVRKTHSTVNEGHLKHKVMNELYNRIRRSKLKESTGYRDFDSYYDAAWEMFMDRVEYVDDAIQGGRGTTYIRFPGDKQVYKIDEEEAVDKLYDLFNDGEDISKAVECIGGLADIASRFNESYRKNLKEGSSFDDYYDAAWEDFLDTVEYVDDAIEGGRGVTYIRFNGDNSVYQIREEEAVDKLDQLFQKGANIAVAVKALKSLAKRSPKN